MLKQEFEQLIGKEVDYDTYDLYNKMYSALPDAITKHDFVNMINIKNIPERKELADAKKNVEEAIKDLQNRIDDLKFEREDLKNNINAFVFPNYFANRATEMDNEIRELNNEIRELKNKLKLLKN